MYDLDDKETGLNEKKEFMYNNRVDNDNDEFYSM